MVGGQLMLALVCERERGGAKWPLTARHLPPPSGSLPFVPAEPLAQSKMVVGEGFDQEAC